MTFKTRKYGCGISNKNQNSHKLEDEVSLRNDLVEELQRMRKGKYDDFMQFQLLTSKLADSLC